MDIILFVAVVANRWRNNFDYVLGFVTRMAVKAAMCPRQCILGLQVVIESPPAPAVWIVAISTAGPQFALMMFVNVAPDAELWCVLEDFRTMTFLAWHDRVSPNKWKLSDVMVKGDVAPPTGIMVAIFAACAKLSFVRILLLVT